MENIQYNKKKHNMENISIEKMKDFFESEDFNVHLFEQDNMQCAEVEKWTNGGVDMILALTPFTKESFFERVNDFNIDEEIDLHRQGHLYKRNFTVRQSLKDFKDFHKMLKATAKKLKSIK